MESQSLYCISRKGNVYFQRWKGKLSFTEIFRKFLAKQENTMYGSFFLCVCDFPPRFFLEELKLLLGVSFLVILPSNFE